MGGGIERNKERKEREKEVRHEASGEKASRKKISQFEDRRVSGKKYHDKLIKTNKYK